LFSALESQTDLEGARFADLYAGSGAVGLEAYSRGAAHVLVVESGAKAARVIRANVAALGADGVVELVVSNVDRVVRGRSAAPYDVVFADPPYAVTDDEVAGVLDGLVARGWLAPGAVVVVERASRSAGPAWPAGVVAERSKKYGETTLWYARYVPGSDNPGGG
jgi:16S rRNA (guanine(966)-N(2))-methyltransferase RsmD